jgi:hypothetical protein
VGFKDVRKEKMEHLHFLCFEDFLGFCIERPHISGVEEGLMDKQLK